MGVIGPALKEAGLRRILKVGLGVATIVAVVAATALAAVDGGSINTIAGTGRYGFSGDGGPARSATFKSPWDIAVDTKGNIYVIDLLSMRVREITRGRVRTIAGTGKCCTTSGTGGRRERHRWGLSASRSTRRATSTSLT
jgi:hypothetical protein